MPSLGRSFWRSFRPFCWDMQSKKRKLQQPTPAQDSSCSAQQNWRNFRERLHDEVLHGDPRQHVTLNQNGLRTCCSFSLFLLTPEHRGVPTCFFFRKGVPVMKCHKLPRGPKSGKEKTHKHKQICGIVPGLGGCQTFVYVFFFRVIPYGGEKTHKQNPPQNPGTIPGKFCLRVLFFMCFFRSPPKTENFQDFRLGLKFSSENETFNRE